MALESPDCIKCKFLSIPADASPSVCQRAGSKHYATRVIRKGVKSCDKFELWKKPDDRKLTGAA